MIIINKFKNKNKKKIKRPIVFSRVPSQQKYCMMKPPQDIFYVHNQGTKHQNSLLL